MHLLCDASIKAYGEAAYFTLIKNGEVVFIISKSRTAPIKQKFTLLRLELSGALTAKFAKYLKELFSIPEENIYLWIDSMMAIHWNKSVPEWWELFIKNRVI